MPARAVVTELLADLAASGVVILEHTSAAGFTLPPDPADRAQVML